VYKTAGNGVRRREAEGGRPNIFLFPFSIFHLSFVIAVCGVNQWQMKNDKWKMKNVPPSNL
jgi:hypothetical protein